MVSLDGAFCVGHDLPVIRLGQPPWKMTWDFAWNTQSVAPFEYPSDDPGHFDIAKCSSWPLRWEPRGIPKVVW